MYRSINFDSSPLYPIISLRRSYKTSGAKLSEAINSIYQWYQNTDLCYAYLANVPSGSGTAFQESRWFSRGWTLQELIAPKHVIFPERAGLTLRAEFWVGG